MSPRLSREERASRMVHNRNSCVLEAAIAVARKHGFNRITRRYVADMAGVSDGSVNGAYGTMDALRNAVMRACVEREHLDVIAQGIVERHPLAMSAPEAVRVRALASRA